MTDIRLRVFPQPPGIPGFSEPIELTVNGSGPVTAGPADARFKIVRVPEKGHRFEWTRQSEPVLFIPWLGAVAPAPTPDPQGDFLFVEAEDERFSAVHTFGVLSHALEVWTRYVHAIGPSRELVWFHNRESSVGSPLLVYIESQPDNAHSAYGFIELGTGLRTEQFRHAGPMWQQPDIIVHELAHQILFASLGFPENFLTNRAWGWQQSENLQANGDFVCFHEAFGDVLAWIVSLHFEEVRKYVIGQTGGDLSRQNVAARIGDLEPQGSTSSVVTLCALRNLTDNLTVAAALGGSELKRETIHRVGNVVSAALYDVFLANYDALRASENPDVALLKSRDSLGHLLAHALSSDAMTANTFSFQSLRRELAQATLPEPTPVTVRDIVNDAFRARGFP